MAGGLATTGLAAAETLAVFTPAAGSAMAAFVGFAAALVRAAAGRPGLRAMVGGFVLNGGVAHEPQVFQLSKLQVRLEQAL